MPHVCEPFPILKMGKRLIKIIFMNLHRGSQHNKQSQLEAAGAEGGAAGLAGGPLEAVLAITPMAIAFAIHTAAAAPACPPATSPKNPATPPRIAPPAAAPTLPVALYAACPPTTAPMPVPTGPIPPLTILISDGVNSLDIYISLSFCLCLGDKNFYFLFPP